VATTPIGLIRSKPTAISNTRKKIISYDHDHMQKASFL
jgi:hypothetical protein